MRNIINISLPEAMAREVKQDVKAGGFSTTSEFFRHLLRWWEEQKLIRDVKASQRELRAGKGKVLRSLKDL